MKEKHDYAKIHEVAQVYKDCFYFQRNPGKYFLSTITNYDGDDIDKSTFFRIQQIDGVVYATPMEDLSELERSEIGKFVGDGCPGIDDGDDGFEISPIGLALAGLIDDEIAKEKSLDIAFDCLCNAHGKDSIRSKQIKEARKKQKK